jgi:hypothetical protein
MVVDQTMHNYIAYCSIIGVITTKYLETNLMQKWDTAIH